MTADVLASLERALRQDDVDRVFSLLVQIGWALRSQGVRGENLETVARWIEQSRNARLTAILTYALGAYAGIPDELFARVMSSQVVPNKGVPSLAAALTLAQLPHEWTQQTQVSFWEQFFLCYPCFFPRVGEEFSARFHKEHPELHPTPSSDMGPRIPSDLRGLVQTRKIEDPASVDATLQRVKACGENPREMVAVIQELPCILRSDNDQVVAWISSELSAEHDATVRSALMGWLLMEGPSSSAKEVLWREFPKATSASERGAIGTWLIQAEVKGTPEPTFRKLWSLETDPEVQVALIRAIGGSATEESLVELQHAFETGSDPAKEAVREAVELYLVSFPASEPAKALRSRIGAPAHPRTPIEHADHVHEGGSQMDDEH